MFTHSCLIFNIAELQALKDAQVNMTNELKRAKEQAAKAGSGSMGGFSGLLSKGKQQHHDDTEYERLVQENESLTRNLQQANDEHKEQVLGCRRISMKFVARGIATKCSQFVRIQRPAG